MTGYRSGLDPEGDGEPLPVVDVGGDSHKPFHKTSGGSVADGLRGSDGDKMTR